MKIAVGLMDFLDPQPNTHKNVAMYGVWRKLLDSRDMFT
jgi:hypothetical protein